MEDFTLKNPIACKYQLLYAVTPIYKLITSSLQTRNKHVSKLIIFLRTGVVKLCTFQTVLSMAQVHAQINGGDQ